MPLEFVARNGIIGLANSTISGSLAVSQSVTAQSFTGSLSGSALAAVTASYAINATGSFIQGGNSFGAAAVIGTNDTNNLTLETNGVSRLFISSSGYMGVGATIPATGGPPQALLDVNGIIRARSGFQIVGNGLTTVLSSSRSDNTFISTLVFNGWGDYAFADKSLLIGYTPQASSYGAGNLYVANTIGIAKSASNATLDVNGNAIVTGSVTSTVGFTGSLLGTATTASYVLNAVSASNAATASSADNFTVRGTLTAQTIVAQTITSSIDFVTGSSRFGSLSSNTHQFTGSVLMTGSLGVVGNTTITGSVISTVGFTGSLSGSASSATSASYALSSSFATTASYATNAANAYIQGGNSFGTTATIGTNDNQSVNIETNGITRLTVSNTGTISAAVSASSRPILENTVIDLHPESSGFNILPFFASDIAYNTLRGGTFTGTPGPGSTYVTPAATAEALFDGSSTYAFFNSTDLSGSYTASIAFPQSYQYGNTIGFSFGNAGWRAQDFKVEILVTGSYYTLDTVTNWQYGNYNKSFNYAEQAVQGARITFSNFAGSGFRIADIYLLNYNSQLGKTVFVGRDGGAIHRSIAVTGSVIASTGFTGSLFGTASYASQSLSSSFATSASFATTSSYAVSSSFATSASAAISSSYAITSTTAATATSAGTVTGTSGQLTSKDDRIIEPNSITSARAQFGFTSWNNDNASPYADFLHLRSYTDPSGGNDNLVIFNKSTIGMRIWQQSWNSASAYDNYRDVALVSGSATGYIPLYQSATVLTGSSIYQSGLNIGIGTTIPNSLLSINGSTSISGSLISSGSSTFSGSVNVSGSISLNGSVLSAVSGFQQTFSAATTWTATHNLNTAYPVITVYDSSNRVVLPASITATSANVVTITFNVATAGSVNILSGQLQQNMVLSNPSAVAIATVLGG